MIAFDIILSIAIVGIFSFAAMRAIKKHNAGKLSKLIELENSFSSEDPTECPKCGNSKETPKGMTPTAPLFHDPTYKARDVWGGTPAHLSHSCWVCSHKVKTRTKSFAEDMLS